MLNLMKYKEEGKRMKRIKGKINWTLVDVIPPRNLRDPNPDEVETPEFNAIWDVIKKWDISTGLDKDHMGNHLYSGATGNHVVAILDSLKVACLKQIIKITEQKT